MHKVEYACHENNPCVILWQKTTCCKQATRCIWNTLSCGCLMLQDGVHANRYPLASNVQWGQYL